MSAGVLGRTVAAPAADAARVAAIRNNLDLKDVGEIAAFGERARREVGASVERLRGEACHADVEGAATLLDRCREAIARLDPSELQPRGGFDNLFNGHTARLHRFRRAFDQASAVIGDLHADLDARRQRTERCIGALNGLHEQTRAFILELDAYIEAGRLRLADARAAEPPMAEEPPPSVEEAATPRAVPEPTGADRLAARLSVLEELRLTALRQLPLVRMVQNTDGFALGDMAGAAEAIARWRQTWNEILAGGYGRDRHKHRPSIAQLAETKLDAMEALDRAARGLAAARARRAEAETSMGKVAAAVG